MDYLDKTDEGKMETDGGKSEESTPSSVPFPPTPPSSPVAAKSPPSSPVRAKSPPSRRRFGFIAEAHADAHADAESSTKSDAVEGDAVKRDGVKGGVGLEEKN